MNQNSYSHKKAPLLSLRGLHKSLGGNPVLRGVDLNVYEGERLVILGRSGGGKSVLLRHIIGLLKPEQGDVLFEEINLTQLGEEDLNPYRKKMGMLFQSGALFDSMSVKENLAFPLIEAGERNRDTIQKKVAEALEMVDLPGEEERMPSELSGGMKKRVALARAIITRPKLMLYDEPTTGLDPIVADSINHLILRLAQKLTMTCIVVTHDMASAFTIASRFAYLVDGKIYFDGSPEALKASKDPVVIRFVRGISEEREVESHLL